MRINILTLKDFHNLYISEKVFSAETLQRASQHVVVTVTRNLS